jgi:hypothetical protein
MPDAYLDALRTLRCFDRLAGHEVMGLSEWQPNTCTTTVTPLGESPQA